MKAAQTKHLLYPWEERFPVFGLEMAYLRRFVQLDVRRVIAMNPFRRVVWLSSGGGFTLLFILLLLLGSDVVYVIGELPYSEWLQYVPIVVFLAATWLAVKAGIDSTWTFRQTRSIDELIVAGVPSISIARQHIAGATIRLLPLAVFISYYLFVAMDISERVMALYGGGAISSGPAIILIALTMQYLYYFYAVIISLLSSNEQFRFYGTAGIILLASAIPIIIIYNYGSNRPHMEPLTISSAMTDYLLKAFAPPGPLSDTIRINYGAVDIKPVWNNTVYCALLQIPMILIAIWVAIRIFSRRLIEVR